MIRALATHHREKNLFLWGNMEKLPPADQFYLHPTHRRKGSFVITSEKAFSGKRSLKILPREYSLIRFNVPAKANGNYMMTFRFLVEGAGKNEVSYVFYPAIGDRNQAWKMLSPRTVTPGKWHTAIYYTQTKDNSNALNGYIFLRNFPAGGKAYIDDFRIMEFR